MEPGNENSLLPGERQLWSGRPQRFSLRPFDFGLLAFGTIWVAGAGTTILAGGGGRVPLVVPILFIGFGLAASWGRVIAGQLALRSTTYLLTDRRLVAVSTRPKHSELSEYLTRLPPPVMKLGADGSGTIGFGGLDFSSQIAAITGAKRNPSTGGALLELRAIPEAARVRDLIAAAQARAAQGPV